MGTALYTKGLILIPCEMGVVQNEQHVLLECTCTELVGMSTYHPEMLEDCGGQWYSRCFMSGSDFADGEQPEGWRPYNPLPVALYVVAWPCSTEPARCIPSSTQDPAAPLLAH